jgi:hypothetical protein
MKMVSLTEAMHRVDKTVENDEFMLRASIINSMIIKAQQCGRNYLTPNDIRRIDVMLGVLQDAQLPPAPNSSQYATQSQTPEPFSGFLAGVEQNLTEAINESTAKK